MLEHKSNLTDNFSSLKVLVSKVMIRFIGTIFENVSNEHIFLAHYTQHFLPFNNYAQILTYNFLHLGELGSKHQ